MAATATGLEPTAVRKLTADQRRTLVAWSLTKCGGPPQLPFVPNAVRRLELEERLWLAGDEAADVAWEERERRRVANGYTTESGLWVPGHVYFTEAYGHLRPPTGPPIPFDLWPEQRAVLEEIREHLRQIWLKARQLGMTWLALHDAFHLLAFDPENPLARILALSRIGGDASKLLLRARTIKDNLPPFLRPEEAMDTRRSMTRFGIVGRGEMASLTGSPEAARSETATLAILDEFGFIKNRGAGGTWTAVQSTLGETGRAIVLSTGNGPEEAPGDGQAFAQLVGKARTGAPDEGSGRRLRFTFLPASTDPKRRSEKWREAERDNYMTDEEFEAEHPETIEQALQGQPATKVYPPAGITAAEKLGRQLDELLGTEDLPAAAAPYRAAIAGIDWGEQTVGLLLWPLERGGFYVAAEVVHAHQEPENLVEPLLEDEPRELDLGTPIAAHYDAAGVQSMRTFLATARRRKATRRIRSAKIPFGDYKEESVKYLRRLFRRTDRGEEQQIIAISPRCATLLRQLRGLEFADDDTGKVEKRDDHGPDALIAGVAPTARRFRADVDDDVDE